LEKFIGAAVTILVMCIFLYVTDRTFRRLLLAKSGLHLRFLGSLVKAMIIIIGVYTALSQFEVAREISRTLLQSGTLIIAVATFAAQQALSNIISGFSISATKPCDIGQKIKVQSGGSVIAEGLVRDMTLRHVVIEQYDGNTCIVPNSVIDGAVIINTNYLAHVGNFMEFEIAYDSDIDKAKAIIARICQSEPLLLDTDRTSIYVSRLTANGIVLKFTAWTKDLNESFQACSNVRQRVVEEFAKEGIVIPYQTVTVQNAAASEGGKNE
jgi:small-conductance mechanosensitive channel